MSDYMNAQPQTSATDVDADLVKRRTVLKFGAAGAAAVAVGVTASAVVPDLRNKGLLSADGAFHAASIALAGAIYTNVYPTSPLIMSPFTDQLPIPKALAPEPIVEVSSWADTPGPGQGQQNSIRNQRHQVFKPRVTIQDVVSGQAERPDPIIYKLTADVAEHSFTTSQVMPIDKAGKPAVSFDSAGNVYPAGTVRSLPKSTIYGFNGQFPGPMINAEYGKPCLVRFENRLHENPLGLDRQDFGAPDWSFLTHLHNAHTAPESDGNPHYAMNFGPKGMGFQPTQWVDSLYLNWPAGGDDNEKQSFFWFHDHREGHTGANVYKGLVGLYPIYDPKDNLDDGDETTGFRLPGVRTNNPDGSFDVKYDIPLAFFDCRLDDGVTTHNDIHDAEYPLVKPGLHPEWWGKTFYKHFPNKGFVGDIFTVNGTAYPTMTVERRKYRFRFLDCSIARIYDFQMMSSSTGPVSAASMGYGGDELQGQWRIPDGQQCMQFVQIASDGGLIPFPFKRDNFELWPAKRVEVIIDFTQYQDGTPTTKGDVVYLTNVAKMTDGRMESTSIRRGIDPNYKIPMIQFVIGDAPAVPDASLIPTKLRPLPAVPSNWQTMLDNRMIFEVQRGSAGGETEWLINGHVYEPSEPGKSLKNKAGLSPLAQQKMGSYNLWEIRNGGGGWIHPVHIHQEEHQALMRNGKIVTPGTKGHPDGVSREDVVALDPSESVIIGRYFRDFVGPYVAHCHNLAHEDHAMMWNWEITP